MKTLSKFDSIVRHVRVRVSDQIKVDLNPESWEFGTGKRIDAAVLAAVLEVPGVVDLTPLALDTIKPGSRKPGRLFYGRLGQVYFALDMLGKPKWAAGCPAYGIYRCTR